MPDQVLEVQVENDHLAKLMKVSTWVGIAELIWNAVDADATVVQAQIVENALAGVDAIEVRDDGSGMTHADALDGFGHLGGSWKRTAQRTRGEKRYLHGREGKGRWAAFALGPVATWESIADVGGHYERVVVEGRADAPGRFVVRDPVKCDGPTGTTVRITGITNTPTGILGDAVLDHLTSAFALYLQQYPVRVTWRSHILDPAEAIDHSAEYQLEMPGAEPATLTVVEWNRDVERAIFLCDENGTPLGDVRAGIQAPKFNFTAYISWPRMREFESYVGLADLGTPVLGDLIDLAREALRNHFRERTNEATRALIAGWEEQKVWPFPDPPTSPLEQVERELFEVVAVAAAPAVNRSDDRQSKKLSLRILRQALEDSPASLQQVLTEVLELPADKVDELARMLRRTSLTNIVTVAKTITNRLNFIAGLELLLFDPDHKKTLLERSQLHRILVNETWIFGEEFAVAVDDKSLTTVLERHLDLLGREQLADEAEVLDEEGKRRIVDLMLARSVPQGRQRREHLIVELKRPTVKIGRDEINQISEYADAVAGDGRFDTNEVQWDFVVVSNELTDFARNRLGGSGLGSGLLEHNRETGIRIWLRTWADLIADAEHRLKFVRQALEYASDEQSAREYLREVHEQYLPSAVVASED